MPIKNRRFMERWGIQEVYALHNAPGLPPGQFAICPSLMLAHSEELRAMIERRLSEIVNHIAAACGGSAEIDYEKGVPVTVNAPEQTEFAAKVAQDISGGCAEDFSFMLNERPGAFILLGNGDSAGLHHPEYNFNDDIIPAGCRWFAELIEQRMKAA